MVIKAAGKDDRSIDHRITGAFEELTDSERRLAEVVRQTRGNLSSYTAQELATRAEVSNATAVRFFQRLGYATYAEARRQSRDQQAWASPISGLAGSASRPDEERSFAAHAKLDCLNLTQTAQALPEQTVRQAVGMLAGAPAVHVVGFRNSMALASYARILLAQVRPNVLLLPMAGMTIAEELVGFRSGDALLAIGFRRRPPLLRDVMMVAARAGLTTVLIADDSAADVARHATLLLPCDNSRHGMFDSYAAAVSLINYLGNAVGPATGEAAAARLRQIEELHTQLLTFGDAGVPRRRPSKA